MRAIRLNVNSHYVKVNFEPAAVMNAAADASHFSCRDAVKLASRVALSSFQRGPPVPPPLKPSLSCISV